MGVREPRIPLRYLQIDPAASRHNGHVTPTLKSLNWLPVKDQLYFRDAVLAFKCMSELAPAYLSDELITRSIFKSDRETRNSQMLNIPLFRSATGQKTFHYRTVNIWNNCCEVTRLRSRLISVQYVTSLGLLRQYQLYFRDSDVCKFVCMYICMYACMYITAFASIPSNRNRGFFLFRASLRSWRDS